jgi:TonB family protein
MAAIAGSRPFLMTPMTYLVRRLTIASGSMGLAALLFQPLLAQGQTAATPAPAPAAAPAAPADPTISDRVKKDAASPLYWIRLNAQKNDAAAPAKPAPRIVEVKPVAAAPRPAPAPAAAAPSGTVAAASVGSATPPPAAAAPSIVAPSAAPNTAAHPAAALSTPAPQTTGATAGLAAGTPQTAGAAAGMAAGAGLAAPSGATAATDAARTATAPVEEPDDSPLALVQAEEPEFPINVMRRLRKGTVQVRFEVQPDGSVGNATVVTTSHRSLNEAALEAVAGWRFQPVRAPRSAVVDLGFDLDS